MPSTHSLISCVKGCFFWALALPVLIVQIPIWFVTCIALCRERKQNGMFLMALDPLFNRWLLHLTGARPDTYTDRILRVGIPGSQVFGSNSNLNYILVYYLTVAPYLFLSFITGYTPDFMRLNGDATWLSCAYTTRIQFIDAFCEKACQKAEIGTIVFIGSGWDMRPADLSNRCGGGIKVVEVDVPAMIDAKEKVCQSIDVPHKVTAIRMMLSTAGDVAALKVQIPTNKKTLFVLEGVSYFMDESVVRALIDLVADYPKGSCLVSDFMTMKPCCLRTLRCFPLPTCRPGKCVMNLALKLIGEPIKCVIECEDQTYGAPLKAVTNFVEGSSGKVMVAHFEETYLGALTVIKKK